MKKALILTVGTGTRADTDIVPPLKKTIRHARPDRVIFLVSTASEPNAERIRTELELGTAATIRRVGDENDVERVFVDALDALRELRAEGFTPDEIEADYTSGTKAMTAGLTLAATAFRCGSLRYISGERAHGVVISGTERFLSIPPSRVLAYHDLQLALQLFRDLQFEAARRLLREISPALLDDHSRRLHASLGKLVDAYDRWDKFEHACFKEHYQHPDPDLHELAAMQVSGQVIGCVQKMAAARNPKYTRDWRDQITQDHLADLWNNAERRQREGKYDDAVARLYRLTEMLAQYRLACEHGINAADVDIEGLKGRIPEELRGALAAQRSGDRAKVQLGLRTSYQLLAALSDPLGDALPAGPNKHSPLTDLLARRNASILAHGLEPVGEQTARELSAEVARLAHTIVPDFAERCAALQFPWLRARE